MAKKYETRFFEYFVVWAMIMCSGTVVFNIKYNSEFIPLFAVLSVFLCIRKYGIRIRAVNIKHFIVLLAIILTNCCAHIFSGMAWNGIIQILLYIVGTWMVLSAMDLERYRSVYINIVVVMALISILVLFAGDFNLIPTEQKNINGKFYLISLLHVVGWDTTRFSRICGLFHEPGMYQIILNTAILFCGNRLLTKVDNITIIQTLILTGTLFLTQSTSGYIAFAVIVFAVWWKIKDIKMKKQWRFFYLLSFPMLCAALLKILTSNTIINKFSTKNISFRIRSNDLLSGIKVICSRPILGYGYSSESYLKGISAFGIEDMSNGMIGFAIMFGVLALTIVLSCLLVNVKKQHWNINSNFVVLFYLIEASVESWIFFPVSLAMVFWREDKIGKADRGKQRIFFTKGSQRRLHC